VATQGMTHRVRFTGGPLYWRKRRRGILIDIADHVDELHVPGLTRRPKREFRGIKDFEADMARGPVMVRTGVYKRVAPDRFRWIGWRS
jgi:hypothetical protein